MDKIDKEIIKILTKNSKVNYKEIGEAIHMTGQAVGNRVRKLEDDGVIKSYTVKTDTKKQGLVVAFVILYMKGNDHYRVKQFAKEHQEVKDVFRVSGEACYFVKVEVDNHQRLNELCDEILRFANYNVSIVVDTIK